MTLSPSTKKATEHPFLTFSFRLYIFNIYSQVLTFISVELNRFAKQTSFLLKRDGGHAISAKKSPRLPKGTARFPVKERWHSPPPPQWVSLGTPLPLPHSLYRRT